VSRRNGVRDRWLPHALDGRTEAGYGCRLMLAAMHTRMSDKGYVSVPRTVLADLLGVHPSQITKWTKEAVDVGLLQKIGGGYHGRTAWFVAVIPSGKVTNDWSPSLDGKVTSGSAPSHESVHLSARVRQAADNVDGKVTNQAAPSGAETGHLSSGQTGHEGDQPLVTHHARVTNVTLKDAPGKDVPPNPPHGRPPCRRPQAGGKGGLRWTGDGPTGNPVEQDHAGSVSPNAVTPTLEQQRAIVFGRTT